MLARNRARVWWVATLASSLDMRNVVLVPHDLKDISIVVSFVCTQMLFSRRARNNHSEHQVIDGPLVVFIGTCHVDCQRRTTLVDKDMYFAS